jgi:VWFA-related protein
MPCFRYLSTRTLFLAAIMAAFVGTRLGAQQIGSNKTEGQPETYTLSVKSQMVVETVVVKDKKGNFIRGLTAKDFTVTEDGTPQTIRYCEQQSLPTTAAPLPPSRPEDEQVTIYKRLTRTSIAPESTTATAGNTDSRYNNHRLLALYFDMTAMPPVDQQRALTAAEKFVRTQMTAADLVSILRFGGGSVDVLQDFTADRNRLLSILETMVVGEGQGSADSIEDAASADTGAAFGQDDSEFNVFNTDRQLAALQTAANMLGQMNEKKALVYFASGMRLNGVDNQAQLHATIDAAIRMGVSFWPVDARGLVAQAPLGDATQANPGNAGMYNGQAALAETGRREQSQDTMYSLAADTGGKALLDNNDLTRGITAAQKAISEYYIVSYYTTNSAPNGRFRKVKITVHREDASLEYRQGYYARKEFAAFNASDKERQLEDALMLGDPITDLTIAMEINYFQLNRAEYYVPIMVKIPGRELALAKKFGAQHTLIDFVCEIKDDIGGITVSNVRDNVNIKLSDATAAELAKRPIEYDAGFTLPPGHYTMKFLARDDETGRIGTYQASFVIPNLNKETRRVPVSSVVLSSQRVDVKDALYNASSGKDSAKNDAANPLVQDGRKLIPSVTRVFSANRELFVYLQAYAKGGVLPATESPMQSGGGAASAQAPAVGASSPGSTVAADPPLLAFVTFYRGDTKVYETQPIALEPLAGTRLGVTPIHFGISLSSLPPAEYQCQVTILDPARQRATFWQGRMKIEASVP